MRKLLFCILTISVFFNPGCKKEENSAFFSGDGRDPDTIEDYNYSGPVLIRNYQLGYQGVLLKHAEISDRGEVVVYGLAKENFMGFIDEKNNFDCYKSKSSEYYLEYPEFDMVYNLIVQNSYLHSIYGIDPTTCATTWESPEITSWPSIPPGAIQTGEAGIQTKNKMRFLAQTWFKSGTYTVSIGVLTPVDFSISEVVSLTGYSLLDLLLVGDNRIGVIVVNKSNNDREIKIYDTNLQLVDENLIDEISIGDYYFPTKNPDGHIIGFIWGYIPGESNELNIYKLDSTGTSVWQKSIDYTDKYRQITAVGPGQFGGFIALAQYNNSSSPTDIYAVLLFDDDGNLEKEISFSGNGIKHKEDQMYIRQLANGDIVVVSDGDSYSGGADGIYVMRMPLNE